MGLPGMGLTVHPARGALRTMTYMPTLGDCGVANGVFDWVSGSVPGMWQLQHLLARQADALERHPCVVLWHSLGGPRRPGTAGAAALPPGS